MHLIVFLFEVFLRESFIKCFSKKNIINDFFNSASDVSPKKIYIINVFSTLKVNFQNFKSVS